MPSRLSVLIEVELPHGSQRYRVWPALSGGDPSDPGVCAEVMAFALQQVAAEVALCQGVPGRLEPLPSGAYRWVPD